MKLLKIILVCALLYGFYHYFLKDTLEPFFKKNKEQVDLLGTQTTFDKVLQDAQNQTIK
jgi:hypothetical protein